MQRQRGLIRTLVAVLAVLTVTVNIVAATGSLTAMSCCAMTHGRCAGLKTADDCCRGMGHLIAAPAATLPSLHNVAAAAPVLAAVAPPAIGNVFGPSSLTRRDVGFKRLHDPPRSHSIPLLI